MVNKYLGVKLICAQPMNRGEYNKFRGWTIPENENPNDEGYLVKYSDDPSDEKAYISWSPKEVFENAYFKLEENPNKNSISEGDVSRFIKSIVAEKIGEKTTLVTVTLINGFEIIETSTCVDKENYDQIIGADICVAKAKDKIWAYLGFMLQAGLGGVKENK